MNRAANALRDIAAGGVAVTVGSHDDVARSDLERQVVDVHRARTLGEHAEAETPWDRGQLDPPRFGQV